MHSKWGWDKWKENFWNHQPFHWFLPCLYCLQIAVPIWAEFGSQESGWLEYVRMTPRELAPSHGMSNYFSRFWVIFEGWWPKRRIEVMWIHLNILSYFTWKVGLFTRHQHSKTVATWGRPRRGSPPWSPRPRRTSCWWPWCLWFRMAVAALTNQCIDRDRNMWVQFKMFKTGWDMMIKWKHTNSKMM